MNQHVIEHTRIVNQGRHITAALAHSYGWQVPSDHSVESVAVDVLRYQRQSVSYGAVSQTMRVVMGWWRAAKL